MLLTYDETKEYVTVPYYSTFRNMPLVNALKVVGFDVSNLLGQRSDSNVFKIPKYTSKFLRDYQVNPGLSIKDSMADVLEGIFPRVVCNTVQKLAGIQTVTISPVMVDRQLWGALVFFLTETGRPEIFEMIAAHCVAALKNISRTEFLEAYNDELIASATERKKAEESLKEREDRLQQLLSDTLEIIQSVSPEGKYIFVNQAWHDLLGYTVDDLKHISLFDVIHPSSMEYFQGMFQGVLKGKSITNIEAKFSR
jgi:PAS domain-containing protein